MSNPKVIFKKIERSNIFDRDFSPLTKNQEISFSHAKICAIYAPNGTGKTSLIKAVEGASDTKFEFEYEDTEYKSNINIFHIINDQNNRNIIQGTAKDFLLGDDIRKEFELKEFIEKELDEVKNSLISILKKNYSISTASNELINFIIDSDLQKLIKELSNSKNKGKLYSATDILDIISKIKFVEIPKYTQEKLSFFQNDISSKDSIFRNIDRIIEKELSPVPNVHEVEENSEAIKILNHFKNSQCIVCDTEGIDREALIQKKNSNKEAILNKLDDEMHKALSQLIEIQTLNDPFGIKETLLSVLQAGNTHLLAPLMQELSAYSLIFINKLQNDFLHTVEESELSEKNKEYNALIANKPEITDEDIIYIEEVINNNMDKKLEVIRDENKNLKISLENREFLGLSRDELPLSTGEQNFLSLTFEFLRAKNLPNPVVIIDDPISSFDSIYKNKVVYALIKVLEAKQKIVLTHNLDLLRLMSAQYPKSYELYILNNSENGDNGFIHVNKKEREMLINLDSLLTFFREDVFDNIKDVNLFLMSMIPFMRGYTNLLGDKSTYNMLTQVMHGYKTQAVDIANVYISLFGNKNNIIPRNFSVVSSSIVSIGTDGIQILDKTAFPLLNKTLIHSLIYLKIRLFVEKSLTGKFPMIDVSDNPQLGKIINQAFSAQGGITEIRQRTRLTSKKTLINEFNHFEGNLSIFQPAIDITDTALAKEKDAIYQLIGQL